MAASVERASTTRAEGIPITGEQRAHFAKTSRQGKRSGIALVLGAVVLASVFWLVLPFISGLGPNGPVLDLTGVGLVMMLSIMGGWMLGAGSVVGLIAKKAPPKL
jgi:hypothetical protein